MCSWQASTSCPSSTSPAQDKPLLLKLWYPARAATAQPGAAGPPVTSAGMAGTTLAESSGGARVRHRV